MRALSQLISGLSKRRFLFLGGSLLCLGLTLFLTYFFTVLRPTPSSAEENPKAGTANKAAAEKSKEPIILLTGFEPFGPEKQPNSSWEGIKSLDGQNWNGCKLVCKQLKVVWGEPQKNLERWIAEYQPVAILSFGQGNVGSFSVEALASNDRGSFPDNNDQLPPSPKVVEDGEKQFRSTFDCGAFARQMSSKGYPIRISSNAGRYLCEEMLYSLEYEKAKEHLEAPVLFCHVPPLGSKIGSMPVDATYVQKFVEDALDTCEAISPFVANQNSSSGSDDPKVQAVEAHIRNYFATWSKQDMNGYGDCFSKGATVQFIDVQDRLLTLPLDKFLASQRESHRNAQHRMTEVPESIEVRMNDKLAHAVVYWKLTSGPRTEFGYDHFTLMQTGGQWKIIHLVFYATKRE